MEGDSDLNKNYIAVMKQPYAFGPLLLALRLVKPKSKVLSIGCGGGREVRYLVQGLNCSVTAIDYNSSMIELSKKIEPHATYHCINVLDFDTQNQFDYIVCLWNTINFMSRKDRRKCIEKAYTLLLPGGSLILTTSHVFQHWRFIFHNIKHQHKYYYLPSEVSWWFAKTLFHVEKVTVQHTQLIVATK